MLQSVADSILQTSPLFAGLEAAGCDLLQAGLLRRYTAGATLFHHGDPVRHVHVLGSGAIQLTRVTPDGHQHTIELLTEGAMVGVMDLFQPSSIRHSTAVILREAMLLEFPLGWFEERVRRHPRLALNLLALMAQRLRAASLETEHKTTMTAAQQVACFLQRLCASRRLTPEGFTLPLSKTVIAARLGMELETLSRALGKIRHHGLAVHGTRVAITHADSLDHFTCRTCSHRDLCPDRRWLQQETSAPSGPKKPVFGGTP